MESFRLLVAIFVGIIVVVWVAREVRFSFSKHDHGSPGGPRRDYLIGAVNTALALIAACCPAGLLLWWWTGNELWILGGLGTYAIPVMYPGP